MSRLWDRAGLNPVCQGLGEAVIGGRVGVSGSVLGHERAHMRVISSPVRLDWLIRKESRLPAVSAHVVLCGGVLCGMSAWWVYSKL